MYFISHTNGQELDYSFYELMKKFVRVQMWEDRIAKFLESYHPIRDYEVHNNV
jgi:hypothetical protein